MKYEEILAGYLDVLDEINQATRIALETLSANAETSRLIIEELLHTPEPFPVELHSVVESFSDEEASSSSEPYIEEDMESLSDKIIARIEENDKKGKEGIFAIDVVFDTDKIDSRELMKLVKEKLAKKDKGEKNEKEEPTDEEIDFQNPLE